MCFGDGGSELDRRLSEVKKSQACSRTRPPSPPHQPLWGRTTRLSPHPACPSSRPKPGKRPRGQRRLSLGSCLQSPWSRRHCWWKVESGVGWVTQARVRISPLLQAGCLTSFFCLFFFAPLNFSSTDCSVKLLMVLPELWQRLNGAITHIQFLHTH